MSEQNPVQTLIQNITAEIKKVYFSEDEFIRTILCCYFSRGHVLLEGPPGTGKTLLAKSISRLMGKDFKRIQFTTDLLPSDIIGAQIYNPKDNDFSFVQGPVFTDTLLADEINRAPARTQSALLEAMEERQVSIEGKKMKLADEFFVIATQNPQDYEGTFALPEVQLDRFMMKLTLGHQSKTQEANILKNLLGHVLQSNFETFQPVQYDAELINTTIRKVHVEDSVLVYTCNLIDYFRKHPMVEFGPSIRAAIALSYCSRVWALASGRDYVIPDDLKALAQPVLRHRLQLTAEAKISSIKEDEVIAEALNKVAVPR